MQPGFNTFISPAELTGCLAEGEPVVIFDTRFALSDAEYGRRSYTKAHIPGAIYAHLDEDLSGPVNAGKTGRHPLPNPDEFAERLRSWGVHSHSQVVVYDDDNGGIAARLWHMLRWLGHDRASVLDGGWRTWIKSGGKTDSEVPVPGPGTFTPSIRTDLFISTEDVMAIRKSAGWRLLDARTADRFAGENETIDPVAGHIPGAVSASYKDTVYEDGTTLSTEELRDWFGRKLQSTPPHRAVFYCGSGVTACRGVLSMEHAGLPGSAVYAGSWSEWIQHSTEIATGPA